MRVLLRILLVLAVPIVLSMGVVRLVTLPWYPAWEYGRSGFPEDPLGMPPDERLRLARACVAFLNLPPGTVELGDLRFSDGSVAFNGREISHMDDVKRVYDRLTAIALFAFVIACVAGWFLGRRWGAATVWGALSDGGLTTLGVLIVLGAWMLLGFEAFFAAFHGVFFQEDSWLFPYSDTLIRLFPLQLWQDVGLIIVGGVGITAFVLALLGRALQKRYALQKARVEEES